jgi:protease I
MKKVLFIIAKNDFRDEEFFVPREILEKAGFEVKVASNTKAGETAVGFLGGEVKVDLSLDEVQVDQFDAVIFVGGAGALVNLDNETSYKIARETKEKNKLLCAICIAPSILAKAGVLQGKKATVWTSALDKKAVKVLQEHGASYQVDPVVEDGNIITANGPQSAKEFAETIARKVNLL